MVFQCIFRNMFLSAKYLKTHLLAIMLVQSYVLNLIEKIFYYLYFIKITVLLMFYFNLEIKKYHIKVVIVNYLLTSQRILYKYTSLLALKKVISSTLFIYVLIIFKGDVKKSLSYSVTKRIFVITVSRQIGN